MTIQMSRADYERIVAYAKAELPNEACGLLAGHLQGDRKVVCKVYFLTNTDHSPEHFTMDPREQLAAVKEMRAEKISPLGNFHSHPETPARLSQEDLRFANDAKASYLILSLAQKDPVLKAFSVQKGVPVPQTLEIV